MKIKRFNSIDGRALIWLGVMGVACLIVLSRLFYM